MRNALAIWMAVGCFAAWAAGRVAVGQPAEAPPDKLEEHFTQAKADLTAGRHREAAVHLVDASRVLQRRVFEATGEVERALVKNTNALKSLAADVLRGHITEPRALDEAAGRAHAALAKFHQVRAERDSAKDDAKQTARELRAATHHLERAAAWLGQSAESTVRVATADANALSAKLTVRAGYLPAEVDRGIQAIGHEIDPPGGQCAIDAREAYNQCVRATPDQRHACADHHEAAHDACPEGTIPPTPPPPPPAPAGSEM